MFRLWLILWLSTEHRFHVDMYSCSFKCLQSAWFADVVQVHSSLLSHRRHTTMQQLSDYWEYQWTEIEAMHADMVKKRW